MASPSSRQATADDSDATGGQLSSGSPRTFFARNRRDGARLLSSALIITVIGLVNWRHPAGLVVALVSGSLSLYWWLRYRQLVA